MLDYRIYTFLKLCELMNYRATANALNMTQPAVTQHIQYLERDYQCKLFHYDGKKLSLTASGLLLQKYAYSARYNELDLRKRLSLPYAQKVKIGATKTIGDYVISEQIASLYKREDLSFCLMIDNTEHLLGMLHRGELDLALIEGFFDKHKFGHKLLKKESFVGICAQNHSFSGKEVQLRDLFGEVLVHREKGSGTREIFEQVLHENNYTFDCFKKTICLSSFELIKKLVLEDMGISFVYESLAKSNKNLGVFTIQGTEILREFNYVFLEDTMAETLISLLEYLV
jgi:DNA-binding transcriptional LysR family regulator